MRYYLLYFRQYIIIPRNRLCRLVDCKLGGIVGGVRRYIKLKLPYRVCNDTCVRCYRSVRGRRDPAARHAGREGGGHEAMAAVRVPYPARRYVCREDSRIETKCRGVRSRRRALPKWLAHGSHDAKLKA